MQYTLFNAVSASNFYACSNTFVLSVLKSFIMQRFGMPGIPILCLMHINQLHYCNVVKTCEYGCPGLLHVYVVLFIVMFIWIIYIVISMNLTSCLVKYDWQLPWLWTYALLNLTGTATWELLHDMLLMCDGAITCFVGLY